MTKKLLILFMLMLACMIPAFSQPTELKLDRTKSKLEWKGSNIVGGGHEGTLQLISGNLVMESNAIKKGDFTIDMNSMKSTDMKGQGATDLISHLKSGDFFSVEQFPQAFFSIVSVSPGKSPGVLNVTGVLRIKGIANTITFPAEIKTSAAGAQAKAEVTIDRTKWEVTYQSKSIFSDLKDGAIADDIIITLNLIFTK